MGFLSPTETLDILGDKAKAKTKLSFLRLFLLSILGGTFIAEGFLACIRISGTMPAEWGSFANFMGGCLFPIGLVAIVLVGGELATGNMMVMTIGAFQKKNSILISLTLLQDQQFVRKEPNLIYLKRQHRYRQFLCLYRHLQKWLISLRPGFGF